MRLRQPPQRTARPIFNAAPAIVEIDRAPLDCLVATYRALAGRRWLIATIDAESRLLARVVCPNDARGRR